MKTTLTLVLLVFLSVSLHAQSHRHEVGLNLAHGIYYQDAVWSSKIAPLHIVSPITYKYFLNEKSALRLSTRFVFTEYERRADHGLWIRKATEYAVSIGYQRMFGNRKFRPYLFGDLEYASSDDYVFENYGRAGETLTIFDQRKKGFNLAGGVGLRYQFNDRWALACEGSLRLNTSETNGYKYTEIFDARESSTVWNDAIETSLRSFPISNFSVNYRF